MAGSLPAWKKGLGISLSVSIIATLAVFLYHFEEDALLDLLELRTEYLLLAVLLFFALWLIEGWRVKLLVKTLTETKELSLLEAIQVFLATYFFASVTPFAAGEWPALIYALNRKGLSVGESSAIAATRALITKASFLVTGVFFLIIFGGKPVPSFLNQIFIIAVAFSVLMALFFTFLLWRPMSMEWVLKKLTGIPLLGPYLKKDSGKMQLYTLVHYELLNFFISSRSLNRFQVGSIFLIVLSTVLFWFCFFNIAPAILLGLNVRVSYLHALMWQFVIQMIIYYFPVPGGSGAAELGLASLFAFFVPSSVLGVFIALWRFFTYYLLLFCGGLAALKNLKP